MALASGIVPGTIYVIVDDDGNEHGQVAVTPDGDGMHWYDTREAAIADRLDLDENPPIVKLTDRELEGLRYEGYTL